MYWRGIYITRCPFHVPSRSNSFLFLIFYNQFRLNVVCMVTMISSACVQQVLLLAEKTKKKTVQPSGIIKSLVIVTALTIGGGVLH